MVSVYVDVTIRNPADRQRSWTGKFLVDTGAFDSLVPRVRLEEIGLEPRGSRDYVLADGNPVAMDITIAEIEFEEEIVGGDYCVWRRRSGTIARRYRIGIRRLRG